MFSINDIKIVLNTINCVFIFQEPQKKVQADKKDLQY